ncbi:transglutaminase-like domain-containing protein [Fulvivirga lutea]|uniref:Transglutaminase domain-containing protein n=1 Tax=Fulvivirga lutea TaxID=2810512 RepID=A0A974WI95_9BACT|nr:transglutaminase-like domain-containing protein [Fulvivirga lutea]QSE95853.1 transglutaminase domain-containing protein [Fulvivirga lutea]
MYRYLLVLILFSLSFSSIAQKVDQESINQAIQLSKIYDDDLVILKSLATYTFYIDKKTNKPMVKKKDKVELLALKNNVTYIMSIGYNDNSSIADFSLKTDRNKSYDYEKACGHVKSGEIFYSDAQFCAYKIDFNLRGRSLVFESEVIYEDLKYLTKAFFHSDAPTLESEIIFEIPKNINVELAEFNFDNYEINKTTSSGEINKYTYNLKNLESTKFVDNAPGRLHYLPHLLILTKSYVEDGVSVNILSSTDDLYKWYKMLTQNLNYRSTTIEQKVKDITKDLTTDKEKIESIYYWVQDNIKYIAFEDGLAGFQPEDAEKVFYNRFGDCKGMANLLKSMLISAGYEAKLAWLGTSTIPYSYDIPSLAVDNHMVCSVQLGEKEYVLDATEKFNQIGYNAERIQGKQLMVENGNDYKILNIPVEPINKYLEKSTINYSIVDGALMVKGETIINGEKKKNLLYYINNTKKDEVQDFVKSEISGNQSPDKFKLIDYSAVDRNNPFIIKFEAALDDNLSSFGNEIYIDLDFTEDFKNEKIKDDRIVPFSFGEKIFKKCTYSLIVPREYKIVNLPKDFSYSNEYYSFQFKYEQEDDKLFYRKEIKILNPILPKTEFNNWNTTIEQINKFYNDQIILEAAD